MPASAGPPGPRSRACRNRYTYLCACAEPVVPVRVQVDAVVLACCASQRELEPVRDRLVRPVMLSDRRGASATQPGRSHAQTTDIQGRAADQGNPPSMQYIRPRSKLLGPGSSPCRHDRAFQTPSVVVVDDEPLIRQSGHHRSGCGDDAVRAGRRGSTARGMRGAGGTSRSPTATASKWCNAHRHLGDAIMNHR